MISVRFVAGDPKMMDAIFKLAGDDTREMFSWELPVGRDGKLTIELVVPLGAEVAEADIDSAITMLQLAKSSIKTGRFKKHTMLEPQKVLSEG